MILHIYLMVKAIASFLITHYFQRRLTEQAFR
jgi:hypothetical protein